MKQYDYVVQYCHMFIKYYVSSGTYRLNGAA